MSYPQSGTTLNLVFANDAEGRRIDAWLQSNPTHSTWSQHEHFGYDSSGRITSVLGQTGPATSPTTVVNQTLCYSAGSTPPTCPTTATADRAKIQWIKDAVSGETSSYNYDTMGRLHIVTITGGTNPRTYTYGYDNAGNRTSASVSGGSPSSQSLNFNNDNQISMTGYSYDASGDMTAQPGHTAVFNANGQQTSTTQGGVTTSYTYAGTQQNELLSETTSGGATYSYTYGRADGNGLPEIEAIDTSATSSTGYILHDNTGLPVMIQTNSSITCLYMYDATGNPILLGNSAQATSVALRYDPYGAATRTDGGTNNGAWLDNPYLFHDGTQDRATGQVKFGQRWYNPGTGTWTQQDTLNKPLYPERANRYQYSGGDPINAVGPTDLLPKWLVYTADIVGVTVATTGPGLASSAEPALAG
jgi:RHS repeat-associated protein